MLAAGKREELSCSSAFTRPGGPQTTTKRTCACPQDAARLVFFLLSHWERGLGSEGLAFRGRPKNRVDVTCFRFLLTTDH